MMSQEHVVQKPMTYAMMHDGNTVEQKSVNIIMKDLVICLSVARALRFMLLLWTESQCRT